MRLFRAMDMQLDAAELERQLDEQPMPVELEDELMNVTEWRDVYVEVALDIGACRHVMAAEDAPWYAVQDSPGSRRGQNFIARNGEQVPHEGQISVNFTADLGGGETTDLRSVFQVADMMRPLMSVLQIRDQGLKCVFTEAHALVMNAAGKTMCNFDRQSGLYVAKLRLRQPEPFDRQS